MSSVSPCCSSSGRHQGVIFGLIVGGQGEEGVWSGFVATSWARGDWGIRRLRLSSLAPSPAWAAGSGWSDRRPHATSRIFLPARQTETTVSAWWCAAAHLRKATGRGVSHGTRRWGEKSARRFNDVPWRARSLHFPTKNYSSWYHSAIGVLTSELL